MFVLVLGLARTEFMQKLDLRLLDYDFIFRQRIYAHAVPVSPDIRLVLVDEASDQKFRSIPHVFWVPMYSEVMRGVLDAGASCVGLDYLLQYYSAEMFEQFGTNLASVANKCCLIGYMNEDELTHQLRLDLPEEHYLAIIGAYNVGLANVTRDLDGIPRAQQIFPYQYKDPETQRDDWAFFAPRLAELHTGKQVDAAARTFGGRPLPLLPPDRERLLINYAGPAFPSYPFWEVLEHVRRHDTGWLHRRFDGKVVLVATGSKAAQDVMETPFSARATRFDPMVQGGSGSSMLGVEVQANILNTLLTGAWLRKAPDALNQVALLALCLLVALLTWRLRVGASAVAALLAAAGFAAAVFLAFCQASLWINLAPALVAVPLVWGGTYGYRYGAEERQRRFVERTFGRYVSPEVMHELLEKTGRLELGGHRRAITVFFSDINGFTTASEERPPEDVIQMLNDYFRDMTRIIFAHQGTIKQFVGDEIMVMYGAPREHPAPEHAAVLTALEMVDCLAQKQEGDPDEKYGFYRIKIGIHSGSVLVGNVGSAERTEYAAVGDTVNLTSRIMNMTKNLGGVILISDLIYERVKDMPGVEFVDKGKQDVRGRAGQIGIYEVRRSPREGDRGVPQELRGT